jgi:hypothetical protein
MTTNSLSSTTIGTLATATGIVGLLGFVFIILFFAAGQPFGTINDVCIGITAIMTIALAWVLHHRLHGRSPVLSQVALVLAFVGGVLVIAGSVLVISGVTGWYLSGLYMSAGNAMVGIWLVVLSYCSIRYEILPRGMDIFGLICGLILALGLVAIPRILQGIDQMEYKLTIFNSIWAVSSIGYLAIYPIWCVLLGRNLLVK